METREELINQLYVALSNISHPLEGTFYLFLIAVMIRWLWPTAWNDFLKRISAEVDIRKKSNKQDD